MLLLFLFQGASSADSDNSFIEDTYDYTSDNSFIEDADDHTSASSENYVESDSEENEMMFNKLKVGIVIFDLYY